MSDTRVVMISGPRQSGKTTLAEKLASDGMPFLTLDDQTALETARADPVGFIRGLDKAVIDEVQRAPELLLAIKRSADTDKRPGHFLVQRVLSGGYPEALPRASWPRRQKWLLDYIKAVIERDVHDIAQIEHSRQLPRLLRVLAQHSSKLVNYSKIGSPLGIGHVTIQKYTGILEQLFLVKTLQPWYTNELKRLVKTPKLHFLDSGLLAAPRNTSPTRLGGDRIPLGAILETFILAELLKLASWHDERIEFFHFRDRDDYEVDIVIEDPRGHVVGIEVKAAATVTATDFSGLRKLAEACGKRFVLGLVLYDHDTTVPFGEKLFALPIATLWK
jgi:hypothetical protein